MVLNFPEFQTQYQGFLDIVFSDDVDVLAPIFANHIRTATDFTMGFAFGFISPNIRFCVFVCTTNITVTMFVS